MNALVDNDVLLKGACLRVLSHLLPHNPAQTGVLTASRYVLPPKIRRFRTGTEGDAVLTELLQYIDSATQTGTDPAGNHVSSRSRANSFESRARIGRWREPTVCRVDHQEHSRVTNRRQEGNFRPGALDRSRAQNRDVNWQGLLSRAALHLAVEHNRHRHTQKSGVPTTHRRPRASHVL